MRLSIFTLILAAGLAVAADTKATYVDGTAGFSANAPVNMELRDSKSMVIHNKAANVEINYARITKVERSTVPVVTEKQPVYKVWNLAKRVIPPTPQEKMMFAYVDAQGAAKSATLVMGKQLADLVSLRILEIRDRAARDAGAWWGDRYWKTNRNQTEWGGAGTLAQRE